MHAEFDLSLCRTAEHLAIALGLSPAMFWSMQNKVGVPADSAPAFHSPGDPLPISLHLIPKRRPAGSNSHRSVIEVIPKHGSDAFKIACRRLLHHLRRRIKGFPLDCVHGLCDRRDTRSNAKAHCGARHLLRLDIANFYKSVDSRKIQCLLESTGIQEDLATALCEAVTYQGVLYDGLPTSAAIANAWIHDCDQDILQSIAKGADPDTIYTRYCDDITLSSHHSPPSEHLVETALQKKGIALNPTKTIRSIVGQPHFVTGLSVNLEHPRVPRQLKRRLRQQAYFCKKYGIVDHARRIHSTTQSAANQLSGLLSYIHAVEPTFAARHSASVREALRLAGVSPTYPSRDRDPTDDVFLVVDESERKKLPWSAVCLVEIHNPTQTRTAITSMRDSIIADPHAGQTRERMAKKGFHFCDDSQDIRTQFVSMLATQDVRAYLCFTRKKLDEETYFGMASSILSGLKPWRRVRSAVMVVEQSSIKQLDAKWERMVNQTLPSSGIRRSSDVSVSGKEEPLLAIPDYLTNMIGAYVELRDDGKPTEQAISRIERLRDKYRLIIDMDKGRRFSRLNPFSIRDL